MKTESKAGFQRIIKFIFPALAAGLLATGCQTYEQQNKVIGYWHDGSLTNAVVEATKEANENANNKDAIVWRLEQGAVLRANGQYEDSNKAFDQRRRRLTTTTRKPKCVSVKKPGVVVESGESRLRRPFLRRHHIEHLQGAELSRARRT